MKVLWIFAVIMLTTAPDVRAAVRDALAISTTTNSTRAGGTAGQRVITTERTATPRVTTLTPRSTSSVASRPDSAGGRGAVKSTSARTTASGTSVATRGATSGVASRGGVVAATSVRGASSVSARAAAIDESSQTIAQTRIGAAYERCKSAFFTCMDQFCSLKNDDYRRCSCSNRVFSLSEARQNLTDAGQQLTVFTENLDVVGMTAAQAVAMKTASEGENALTADTSASKALLQAIMNSIRGKDSTVGGKYSELDSINISVDMSNAYGTTDSGQTIAKNNGQNLYSAVYPQCRAAVKEDCNDASLQRAVTAYLMAIEQDCNTVQTAIEEKQKQMKSAIREGSAMLDLARVENRQKHNSSDIATCIAEVEAAILSEEVCGAGYHRCLDNGEYIDITTGAPIAGVVDFYKLGKLLTFADGVDAAAQTLARIPGNRSFVVNFEKRVKKFAQPALDKCTESADDVWAEYLDKAMLDIFYAQQSKVEQIKQGCFDFVSACYMNGDTAITAAMKALTGDSSVVVQPSKIALNAQMCTEYVDSCNNMFDNNIIANYIDNRTDSDTLTACRAVVQQCFDKYGGKNYENFYYPYSGLFSKGEAPDWFTLYEYETKTPTDENDATLYPLKLGDRYARYKSECAKQLTTIDACNKKDLIESVFGGLDKKDGKYGTFQGENLNHRSLRPTGVATEVYNQVVDVLNTQCLNVDGRFVEYQNFNLDDKIVAYGGNGRSICQVNTAFFGNVATDYSLADGENVCPRDYNMNVDTASWGACLCWANGGRRSKWGKSAKCIAGFPVVVADDNNANDASCADDGTGSPYAVVSVKNFDQTFPAENWCITIDRTTNNQVCIAGDSQRPCGRDGAPVDRLLPKGVVF